MNCLQEGRRELPCWQVRYEFRDGAGRCCRSMHACHPNVPKMLPGGYCSSFAFCVAPLVFCLWLKICGCADFYSWMSVLETLAAGFSALWLTSDELHCAVQHVSCAMLLLMFIEHLGSWWQSRTSNSEFMVGCNSGQARCGILEGSLGECPWVSIEETCRKSFERR